MTEEALIDTERMVRSVRENLLSIREMVYERIEDKMQKAMAK